MSKVLYIKANPKTSDRSFTFRMSDTFVDAYREAHPDDEITTIDLYDEGIGPLTREQLADMFGAHEMDFYKYAKQFAAADKYVIAAPMWNFSFPSILKAYIDHIVMAGITFNYTDQGPVGLLAGKGKRLMHVTARGGAGYTDGPMAEFELGDTYIRKIMGFIGVEDVSSLVFEGTAMGAPDDIETKFLEKIRGVKNVAETF